MPQVTINGKQLDGVEKKRLIVKEVTDLMERLYNAPRQSILVVINEDPPENVGIGGTLVIDRKN